MAGRSRRKAAKRRNTTRKSRVSWQPFTGGVLFLVILALGYMSIADKNKALLSEIREQQQELDRLYKEHTREEARWNAMKSAERLESSMRAHGIDMNLPKPHQIVRMGSDGQPVKGQHSVAFLRKKIAESVASTTE